MSSQPISELAKFENNSLDGYYLTLQKQVRTSRGGGSYLSLTLADKSGQVEARMWDRIEETGAFEKGDVVKVRAQVQRYDGRLQLKIERLRAAIPGEYDMADFLPSTTCDIEQLWNELISAVSRCSNHFIRTLLDSVLAAPNVAQQLRQAPAAKNLHHAWLGGLVEHIVSLLGLAERVVPHYPELDRDLVVAGVILHDIGKLEELAWTNGFEYTLEGQLLGHIEMGAALAARHMDAIPDFPPRLRTVVLHIILSHHGKLEYGSPKLPMLPEAFVLSAIDDLDAKLQTMRTEFGKCAAQGRPADSMTDRVWALDRSILDTRAYLRNDPSLKAAPAGHTGVATEEAEQPGGQHSAAGHPAEDASEPAYTHEPVPPPVQEPLGLFSQNPDSLPSSGGESSR